MLRVTLEIEPRGDRDVARTVATVEIANVTDDASRASSDHAWRVTIRRRDGSEAVSVGWLVDQRSGVDGSLRLVSAVLSEHHSGRPLPFDGHGRVAAPEGQGCRTPADWWRDYDERRG